MLGARGGCVLRATDAANDMGLVDWDQCHYSLQGRAVKESLEESLDKVLPVKRKVKRWALVTVSLTRCMVPR